MILPTFSHLQRAMLCPASCTFPHAKHHSPAAEQGKAVHAFLAAVPKLGADRALEKVPDAYRDLCESIHLDAIPGLDKAEFVDEIAIAYNVQTGEARVVGVDIGRTYPDLGPYWIYGTIDKLGLTPSEIIIWDFKTGWGHVPAPEDNWQLKACAVAACAAYERRRARVGLIHISNDGRDPRTVDAELSPFELSLAQGKLAHLVDVLYKLRDNPALDPPIVEGEHCNFCPAFAHCPAKHQLAVRLATDPCAVREEVLSLLTPENAKQAYLKVQALGRILEQVMGALESYARQNPIELADGRIFGPHPYTQERLIGKDAQPSIDRILGEGYADQAIEKQLTKAGVKRAVRKYLHDHPNSKQTIKQLEEDLFSDLRQVGAARKITTHPVSEYKPKAA